MHPRRVRGLSPWDSLKSSTKRARQEAAVLAFVRERGIAHPREVDAHFSHGRVTNWFGGSSNASTQMLNTMHYRGLAAGGAARWGHPGVCGARALGAAGGRRPPSTWRASRMDALVDVIVRKYAPLPAASLGFLVNRLQYGAPQWAKDRAAALKRAKRSSRPRSGRWHRLVLAAGGEASLSRWRLDDEVRLFTPFDPIVWDRRRFEIFWGWAYRFEAYTPAPKRKLGYYALPLLWQEHSHRLGQCQPWPRAD